MRRPHIVKAMEYSASDRRQRMTGGHVEWRDDSGDLDPFFDEEEDEREWKKVDLGGFPRGLDLVGVCLRVVWKDKEILAYHAASMALCLTILFAFMAAITDGFNQEYFERDYNPMMLIIQLFPYLVIASFIGAYFGAATMTVATIRMKGGNPTFADGIDGAARKSPLIFTWAIYAAIVGTIIALVRSRRGAARVAADATQLAWSVATYFVVPVMLFENRGPLSAVKRSTSIMKRTWKESLAGNLGMGAVFFSLLILGLLVLFPIGASLWGIAGGVLLVVPWFVVVLTLSSAANNVLVAALYWLARTGKIPAEMDGYENPDLMPMFSGLYDGDTEDAHLSADELTRKYAR